MSELDARGLYLELLKRTLTGATAEDSDEIMGLDTTPWLPRSRRHRAADSVAARMGRFGIEIVRKRPYHEETRASGRDWPARAESMIGLARMDNIQFCVETVLGDGICGDLIETGVWRGGATIFMRGLLKAYGSDRKVWVADSFAGLPAPDPIRFPSDAGSDLHTVAALAVSKETVEHNFRRYGLLDGQVKFLEGWFSETLPTAPIDRLAVLRLDGDLYESTMDALTPLYPKLEPGGFVIVDDYGDFDTCRRAISDYRDAHGISESIADIDGRAVYWRKG
jgi:O-methyltransferase